MSEPSSEIQTHIRPDTGSDIVPAATDEAGLIPAEHGADVDAASSKPTSLLDAVLLGRPFYIQYLGWSPVAAMPLQTSNKAKVIRFFRPGQPPLKAEAGSDSDADADSSERAKRGEGGGMESPALDTEGEFDGGYSEHWPSWEDYDQRRDREIPVPMLADFETSQYPKLTGFHVEARTDGLFILTLQINPIGLSLPLKKAGNEPAKHEDQLDTYEDLVADFPESIWAPIDNMARDVSMHIKTELGHHHDHHAAKEYRQRSRSRIAKGFRSLWPLPALAVFWTAFILVDTFFPAFDAIGHTIGPLTVTGDSLVWLPPDLRTLSLTIGPLAIEGRWRVPIGIIGWGSVGVLISVLILRNRRWLGQYGFLAGGLTYLVFAPVFGVVETVDGPYAELLFGVLLTCFALAVIGWWLVLVGTVNPDRMDPERHLVAAPVRLKPPNNDQALRHKLEPASFPDTHLLGLEADPRGKRLMHPVRRPALAQLRVRYLKMYETLKEELGDQRKRELSVLSWTLPLSRFGIVLSAVFAVFGVITPGTGLGDSMFGIAFWALLFFLIALVLSLIGILILLQFFLAPRIRLLHQAMGFYWALNPLNDVIHALTRREPTASQSASFFHDRNPGSLRFNDLINGLEARLGADRELRTTRQWWASLLTGGVGGVVALMALLPVLR